MIDEKFVDLYARNSGVRDKLLVERDVVLTYALQALVQDGVMENLAFKGGTCLRKQVFGSDGRFSEDLDFTVDTTGNVDDTLERLLGVFDREHFGIRFEVGDFYKTDEEGSFGGDITYRHAWNQGGRFHLQVSLRERPTLPVLPKPLEPQSYFQRLEFRAPEVRRLHVAEIMAEKVRATFQRVKVRDVYDLHLFARRPFDAEILRRLVVLKLWQSKDPFDPTRLFAKLRSSDYDWDDVRRLLRTGQAMDPETILRSVEERYRGLAALTSLEAAVVADRSGRKEALAENLRTEVRAMAGFEADDVSRRP